MRLIVSMLSTLLVLAILPTAVLAGEGCSRGASIAQEFFDAADEDGNGALSPAEYEVSELADFGATFADYDVDRDGEASRAEYLELYERQHSVEERIDL